MKGLAIGNTYSETFLYWSLRKSVLHEYWTTFKIQEKSENFLT
jgi:hypothetical protein